MTAPVATFTGNVGYVILPSPKDLPVIGGLFRGPLDAPIPDETMDVDTSMKNLGFVAEDGIDESEDRPTTKIFAWGGDLVAVPQDSYSLTQQFTLYEFLNPEVAKASYGDENVDVAAATTTAGTKMSIAVTSDAFEMHTWLIDTYGVGGKRVQKFVPLGQVTNKDTQKCNHKTVLAHRLTVECFPDLTGKYAYIRTDDGIFSV
jgi:hypothetical protein